MLLHARFETRPPGRFSSSPQFRPIDPVENLYKSWTDWHQSFVMAHDILEHDEGDNGELEREYVALGVGFYLRHNCDYYGQKDSYRDYSGFGPGFRNNMLNDLRIVVGGAADSSYSGWHAPPRDVKYVDLTKEQTKALDYIWTQVEKNFRRWNYYRKQNQRRQAHLRYAKMWFRYGIEVGRARYGKAHPGDLISLFSRVKENIKAIGENVPAIVDIVVDTEKTDYVLTLQRLENEYANVID